MIEKMLKVSIVTPKENIDNLLKAVVKSKLIHLTQVDSNLYLNEIQELNLKKEELQFLNSVYQDLDRFFLAYGKSFAYNNLDEKKDISFDKAKNKLLAIQEAQTSWKQELALLDQNENILLQYEDLIDKFHNVIPNLPQNSDLTTRGIIITNLTLEVQNLLKNTLKNETEGNYHLQLHQISRNLAIGSITYPKLYDKNMRGLLEKLHITDLVLPKELPGNSIDEKLRNFENQKIANQELRSNLLIKLDLFFQNYLTLTKHKEFIYESFYNLESLKFLRSSEFFIVLEGFIPASQIERLKTIIDAQLLGNYTINIEEALDNAPIKITNRRGIREFEIFTGMVQPLAYNTIDPTFLMALVFPFFFGFIIGDIGYGFIISALGLILYLKFYNVPEMKGISNLGWVYFVSGLFSVAFGFLFGEFFGDFGENFGFHPILYNRSVNVMDLLIISITIGVCHVMLGILLGIINARKIHDHHKAGSSIGYFLTNLGLILLFVSFFLSPIQLFQPILVIILVVGFIFLTKFEGVVALIELISYFGNMLSYARLMALGIASVILADIANDFFFIAGGGIPGLMLALTMHGISIAIAMFSPMIHSMRLHLVEFFSKFVLDGIEVYHPFGVDLL